MVSCHVIGYRVWSLKCLSENKRQSDMMSPLRVRHVVAQSVPWRCQVEQEPIQNPQNGVIRVRSIQDFPSNNSIVIILQEFYKPLLLSILVLFYLSNLGVVWLPSSMNIQFQLFGRLGFRQRLICQIQLRTSQQVSRCVQHYLEQYMCDTLPFVHQPLQHPGFRSTSTCPWKVNSMVRHTSANCSSCTQRRLRKF